MSSPAAGREARNAGAARGRAAAFLASVFRGFAALLPAVGVVAPKGLVVLLALAAVLAVPAFRAARGRWPIPDRRIALPAALLVAWCAIASFWSDDVSRSLGLALRVAAILAAGLVLFEAASALDGDARARVGKWLVGGFVPVPVLMAVEAGLGYPLLRAFHEAYAGNESIFFNRGAVALALIAWPATAFLRSGRPGRAALLLPVALGAASLFLESAAATLGFAVGVAAVPAVALHRRAGRAILAAAVVLAFVGTPFAALEMRDRGWSEADWLSGSARHRVEIWAFAAERIAERPLLGRGFDGSRHIGARTAGDGAERPPMPLHPHNGPLQILLELGVVGAALGVALLWRVAARIDDLPFPARRFAQAQFLAALAIGCVAFGLWQNWWLALLVSAALPASLAAAPGGRVPPAREGRAG